MRTIFQNPFAKRVHTYCAFCKTPRRVYRKRRIGFSDILASGLGAALVMGFVFQELDARAILFWVGFLAVAEIFVQMRWRLTIVCQHCGFDPVLYLKNSALAAEKVTARLARRKEDPSTLLATPLQIPKRRPPPPEKGKPGSRLSKQV